MKVNSLLILMKTIPFAETPKIEFTVYEKTDDRLYFNGRQEI